MNTINLFIYRYNIDLKSKYISSIKKRRSSKQSNNIVGPRRLRKSRHRRSPGTVETPTTRSSSFRPDRKPRNPRCPNRMLVSALCAAPRTCSRVATRATRTSARPATTWTTSIRSGRATSAEGSWPPTQAEANRHSHRRGRTCWILHQCHHRGGIARPLR